MTAAEGLVVSIHLSPARGLPMRPVEQAVANAGHGLDGDRYRNSRHRHVSVQSVEALAEAEAAFGSPIDHALTRRNVTIAGSRVPTHPGDRLSIGPLLLEVVRIAAPCRLLDDQIGDGARVALRRRAGSIMRVLGGGVLAVGDPVRVIDA